MDLEERFDVAVIGGGPAGATAARRAAEKGASVLLLEENVSRNKTIRCTGLISLRAFLEAGVGSDCILRKINGAFVYTPDGRRLSIDGQATKAFVIDRNRFEQELLHKAIDAGVYVRTGAKAIGLEANKIKLQEEGRQRIVKAKVIIGADGPNSKVARWVGLPAPQKMLSAIQAIIPYKPERGDFVEVFLGREIAPSFFAWAVPAAEGLARVGLATDAAKGSLKLLLDRLLERFKDKGIIELGGGAIPIGPAARTVTDHVLLVGAAAGQAKPTSGGGIYTGILCAKLAGEVAAKCALDGDASAKALSEYEKRWRDLLEREIVFGLQAHKILCRLSDADLNKIFALLDSPKILKIFTQYGDIDYPSILARELIKVPQIWGGLLRIIPAKEVLTGILRFLV